MNQLVFFFSEALNSIRRSGLMMILSIATITLSLLIFGIFLIITMNANNFANYMTSKLEIRIFLNEGLTRNEIQAFQERLSNQNEIDQVDYISKEKAWESFKQDYPSLQLDVMVEENPLPNAFNVKVAKDANIKALSEAIALNTDIVEDVAYGGEVAGYIQKAVRFMRYAGMGLVGILTLATLFIIVNTIRLTVINRQTEISIMKLVGATHFFISAPFIIEGLFMGIMGAALSITIINIMYSVIGIKIQTTISFLPIVFKATAIHRIYGCIAALGVILGIAGAYISVSKSLKSTV